MECEEKRNTLLHVKSYLQLEIAQIRGSRYFHAIFNKDTGSIIHCDGAIRIYSESELADRMRFHVRSSDVRKVGKRVKIFQTNDSFWRTLRLI